MSLLSKVKKDRREYIPVVVYIVKKNIMSGNIQCKKQFRKTKRRDKLAYISLYINVVFKI